MPGSVDFIYNNDPDNTQFGWLADGEDVMYLLEWTAGSTAGTPSAVVCVCKAIGGWNIGHYDVSLNADLTACALPASPPLP